MCAARALHFVFKIANRNQTIEFCKNVLGMKVLRHEEFTEGCKASCNGPYDGKWSKTMVGYGSENDHFVLELTYNYGIGSYCLGNDFKWILIENSDAFRNISTGLCPFKKISDHVVEVQMPGGYCFHIKNQKSVGDPIKIVALTCSNLERSIEFWSRKCGMQLVSSNSQEAILTFGPEQCSLQLIAIPARVEHATAFGRIAFSCPRDQLPALERRMVTGNETVLKPLVSLDTPGKATVEVVILADPDGHEICFVGDEAFRQLSQIDPNSDRALAEAMAADKSDHWFAIHGGKSAQ